MSGGYFDYRQHRMDDIIEEIEDVIENNDAGFCFNQAIIGELTNAIMALKTAYVYTHSIDYLLSGDYGHEIFLERLKDSLSLMDSDVGE